MRHDRGRRSLSGWCALKPSLRRRKGREGGRRRLLEPICLDSLPLKEVTLAEVFHDAGYETVHIGKWHLGRAESYSQAHGFKINIGGTLWGAPQTFFYPYNGDNYFRDWRYVPDLEPGSDGDYLTDALTDQALKVIDRNTAMKRPFFLNLWYHTVHTPIEGKPGLVAHYEKKISIQSTKQKNPHYAAMVHSLDENVGRVLTRLKTLGIENDTVLIFTSDNGGFANTCKLHKGLQVANNSPLRSGKGSCWEGGIRVPLIVRTPEGAKTEIFTQPVISCDLYPTLLSLAGLEGRANDAMDGVDLSSFIKNPSLSQQRDTLYFHYPHYYPTTTPVSAVRRGKWKLLEFFEPDRLVELYDLSTDLGETTNLAQSNSVKRDELLQALADWRKSVGAKLPEVNPDFGSRKN